MLRGKAKQTKGVKVKNKGFTLIEMMIVVAIIAVLVGISLPSLLGNRRTANQQAALAEIRTIGTAAEGYFIANDNYPSSNFFSTLYTDGYLPSRYNTANASITKSGYTNSVASAGPTAYTVQATPINENLGQKCYRVTEGGTIEQEDYSGSSCTGSWSSI